jgi:hypothetical protein
MNTSAQNHIYEKNDEEKFLINQLTSAREQLLELENLESELKHRKAIAKNHIMVVENAIIDYMQGNGLVETTRFRITQHFAVDVEDESAVPDLYIRIKTTREVNKALIKAEKPSANWYKLKPSITLTFKEAKQ